MNLDSIISMKCASCKNSKSDEQCRAIAIPGLLFCGRHAKAKNVRHWAEVNRVADKVIVIQKVWRGYLYRNWIKEAGPGCLKRSLCHNEEELVTMDSKETLYPFDYFSFEENGKVWWFDIRSMFSILESNLHPQNPYTRVALPIGDRKRLRELCFRRKRFGFDLYYTNPKLITRSDFMNTLWTFISQVLDENGFDSIHPHIIDSMSIQEYFVFLAMFIKDLKVIACDHIKSGSRRHKYVVWTRRVLNNLYTSRDIDIDFAKLFLTIFKDTKDPFPYCYIFASVVYRM
jgi:hypothetical protein